MGMLAFLSKAKAQYRIKQYAKMMNGMSPVFSNFGNDVYASDIVQNAIRCIGTEMSKLQPKHIRTDPSTGLESVINSDINRLFKYGPNEWMSTSDFIEKIVYLREVHKNVYIYPMYDRIPIAEGKHKRVYKGLYPLNPSLTEFKEDDLGRLWITFTFASGYTFDCLYSDIIHWRKDYSQNDIVGGDITGQANNKSLLKLLQTDDIAIQGLEKGVKASLGIRAVMKINTMLDDEKQEEERRQFEQKLMSNESGIIPMDLKGDFIPISLNPKLVDKDTMEFIGQRILANYGVSLSIYNGDYTEEQYQAFYEKVLEPMLISLGRVFSRILFTERELDVGNEIIFYNQGLSFMNTSNKIQATDILTRLGTLTDNQVLKIFGYPPFEGGNVRKQSLNYINRDIADTYQLSKTKTGKESANEP